MVLFKWGSQMEYKKAIKFTFHYGSIQMNIARDMHFCFFVFTFHYGSIQIGPNGLRYFWYAEFTFHYGSIQIIRN